jgi:hypothetical protein
MAGLDPAIHVLLSEAKTWMPGTRPGMTRVGFSDKFAGIRTSVERRRSRSLEYSDEQEAFALLSGLSPFEARYARTSG